MMKQMESEMVALEVLLKVRRMDAVTGQRNKRGIK